MGSLRRYVFPSSVVIVAIVSWTLLLVAVTSIHAAVSVPRILVLNSYNISYDWWEDEMEGLRDGLSRVYPRIDLYVEHLDTKKFHTKKHFPSEAALLESKYVNRPLDVIIAMDNAALEFALQYRQRISPGTPLVFCGINDYEPSMIAGQSRITGVAEFHDSAGTLGLALQLHPATREVVVIHDYTDTGLLMRSELKKTAIQYPGVKLEFMDEMPLEMAVEKLKGLTPGQLVLMLSYTIEKGRRTFSQSQAAQLVSNASPVPVYAVHAAQLGNGVVGGQMMEGQVQGRKAAELTVRVIAGESPEIMPVITGNLARPMFDYSVLKKFDINPDKLPADKILINKPLSTLAVNKTVVWGASLFTLFCSLGLVVLTLNLRKRKRLEEMLRQRIDQHQESKEDLLATEEMLRSQVEEYIISQDKLHAAEEELRLQMEVLEESSQKFKAVFDNSPITVALSTLPDGAFSEVNQSFIDMFGFSRDEAIGKTTLELGVWLSEDDRNRYLKLLGENGVVRDFVVDMRRKGGEEFTVCFSGALLKIAGKPFVLSAVMDVSEQKRLQNSLQQSQKMDVVGQLAGGIAHDFNNMLAGIMAAAEMLKRRLPGDERNHKMVDTIIEAAARSAELTRELLTFSRKGSVVSSPVRIHDTIAAVMSLLERTIDKKIQLTARLADGCPIVMGDQAQLQNALLNLGVNARDAMPQGGKLTYATTAKLMDESACRTSGLSLPPGRYLEIMVSDTGVGMTRNIMERIFEPFFTTKAVGKGTGLGLAAVYGTVRSHQGEVTVQSEPGLGSVFRIYLPMVEVEPVPLVITAEAVTGKGGILLVDDEIILREVGRDLLEDLGYTVYLAEDGIQAIEKYAAHRYDISLVLLDVMMSKMGGTEAFLLLREQNPDLKILFCSGFSNEGTADDLVALGANGFIQKPYSRNELSRAIAEALAH